MSQAKDLETRAKEMAEYYVGREMTKSEIGVCLERVLQENPKLHKLLVVEVRQIRQG